MRKNRRLEEGFARPCVSCYSFSTRKKKNKFFFFFFEKDRESWTLYFLRCKLCLLKVCNQKRASMHIRSDFLAIDRINPYEASIKKKNTDGKAVTTMPRHYYWVKFFFSSLLLFFFSFISKTCEWQEWQECQSVRD